MAESVIETVKELLKGANGQVRDELVRELQDAIVATETPEQTAMRIGFYPLQTSTAKIGQELKIFESLTNDGPSTVEDLSRRANAHPAILGRILKFMAAMGQIRETDINTYSANAQCRHLAAPEAIIAIKHWFENGIWFYPEYVSSLRAKNYQPFSENDTMPFKSAWKTELDTWTWFEQHPENFQYLAQWMAQGQLDRDRWMEEYPVEKEAGDWEADMPVFVDIGGNIGQNCAQLKKRYPQLPGRVILEDRPDTIAEAMDTPGVEKVIHDFFEPQPVQGAKFYYLGWILHNWHDEKAKQILRQIKTAMSPQSVVLINDIIMPEAKVPAYAVSIDILMMGVFGTEERSKTQWESLIEDVGLETQGYHMYNPENCYGIIAVGLKK